MRKPSPYQYLYDLLPVEGSRTVAIPMKQLVGHQKKYIRSAIRRFAKKNKIYLATKFTNPCLTDYTLFVAVK